MKVFEYWAKSMQRAMGAEGRNYWLVGWAGSNISLEDAKDEAEKRVAGIQSSLNDKGWLKGSYEYDHDLRIKEMVIERFGDEENPYAVITRNRYGALVLNAARVFIADVDLPVLEDLPPEPVFKETKPIGASPVEKIGFFTKLFGGNAVKKSERQDKLINDWQEASLKREQLLANQREDALSRFEGFNKQYPTLSFCVYATAAGYRVVVTNQIIEPDSAESEEWMEALDSDELYQKLCKRQQCYRARLTPKPWRLPDCKTSVFFPDGQCTEENGLEGWLVQYEEKSKPYAVCTLVGSYGEGVVVGEVEDVLKVHDGYVLSDAGKELA